MSIIDEIKEEIKNLNAKLKSIQESCCHPEEAVTKEHKSDTGNWDKSDDCYWTVNYCSLCEKMWSEDR